MSRAPVPPRGKEQSKGIGGSARLEAHYPGRAARVPRVRDELSRFAELVKSPEHIHTYRITPLSLWNAAASGIAVALVIAGLAAATVFASALSLNVARNIFV